MIKEISKEDMSEFKVDIQAQYNRNLTIKTLKIAQNHHHKKGYLKLRFKSHLNLIYCQVQKLAIKHQVLTTFSLKECRK